MKKYTTIFIDIDNITYELHNNKHMHSYGLQMVEQMLKKGLRSLENFEVIALLGKNEIYGRNYILKNRLEFIKTVSKENMCCAKNNDTYLEYLLKYFCRTKKEVLIVSGNPNMLYVANSIGLDTCYFNMFTPNFLQIETDITINKLQELSKYSIVKQKSKVIDLSDINISSNYHYYIDSSLVKLLEEKSISLQKYDNDKNKFLRHKFVDEVPYAITMDLALAKRFKEQGCITCFINNHHNDTVDYVADYEYSIENLDKCLEKIMNR